MKKRSFIRSLLLGSVIGLFLGFALISLLDLCSRRDFTEEPRRGGIGKMFLSPDKQQVFVVLGYDSVYDYGGIWVSDISYPNWRKLWHASAEKKQVVGDASWSPDGKNICFSYLERRWGRRKESLFLPVEIPYFKFAVVSARESTFRLLDSEGAGHFADFSPSGNMIALTARYSRYFGIKSQRNLLLIDLDRDERRILLDDIAVLAWGWMPDGRRIIYSPKDITEIRTIDIFTLEEETILEGFALGRPKFSPDGKKMVFQDKKDDLRGPYFLAYQDTEGKWEAAEFDHGVPEIWFDDNVRIVFVTFDRENDVSTLWVLDTVSGEKEKVIVMPRGAFYVGLDWLSDSEFIFSDGNTISTVNIDGTGLKQVFSLEQFEK